jgi:hypothetical protein
VGFSASRALGGRRRRAPAGARVFSRTVIFSDRFF